MAKRLFTIALVLLSLTTAACGGGGGSSPALPGGSPTMAPTVAASGGTSLSTTGTAITSGSVTGITSSVTVVGNGSVTSTESSNQPVGLPAISAIAHKAPAQSLRATAATSNTPLVYLSLTATTATTISGFSAATFTFASVPSGGVYLAYYTGRAWATIGSAAAVSGNTATFAATAFTPPIAVPVNSSLFIAVYTGGVLGGSATPNPSPSPSATATSTAAASGTFVDTACPSQTQAVSDNTLTNVASTFFSTIIPNAKVICLSAWDLSGNITSALVTAAQNKASVTVITPYSEYSDNSGDIAQIVAAGGHAKYEYTSSSAPASPTASIAYQSSPMDIHAKFALIDGVAYMDGHNWFTTDVIMKDDYAGDFAAIQSDLVSFATPAPSGTTNNTFTTDKQLSLQNESLFIQNVVIPDINTGAADEFDFITESFNPNNSSGDYNDDVYNGICDVAAIPSKPILRAMFEDESGYSSSAQSAIKNLGLLDSNAILSTENDGGLEKISMIRKAGVPVAAWFGSSNATTTDLFDWGMVVNDSNLLAALSTYYNAVPSNTGATVISVGSGTPTSCGTIHS